MSVARRRRRPTIQPDEEPPLGFFIGMVWVFVIEGCFVVGGLALYWLLLRILP